MSDYFREVELGLRAAVQGKARRSWRARLRPRQMRAVAFAMVSLVMAGSALAATGVIPFGSPVRVSGSRNPAVGNGVPAPGGSRLLALRVADPAGGPPWGMRIVRTTRGLLCVQIGRVEDGRLGVLGIDGQFHDDGRFHPLPAAALPHTVPGLARSFASPGEDTSCHLDSEAFWSRQLGMDRSAGGPEITIHSPLERLRDVYFGLLGAPALSVSYRSEGALHIQQTVPGIGAFLIVTATRRGEMIDSGDGTSGTAAGLAPLWDGPVESFTYKLAGKSCERTRRGVLAKMPCGRLAYPRRAPAPLPAQRDTPISVRLDVARGIVRRAEVSFRAPVAIAGASQSYFIAVPTTSCGGRRGIGGYTGAFTERDVPAGATLSASVQYPFQGDCRDHRLTIQVFYEEIGHARALVGTTTIRQPPGTKAVPPRRIVRHPPRKASKTPSR
jgi:hypothetical protein